MAPADYVPSGRPDGRGALPDRSLAEAAGAAVKLAFSSRHRHGPTDRGICREKRHRRSPEECTLRLDLPNEVNFEPVRTTALRLEVVFRKSSAAVQEWRVD